MLTGHIKHQNNADLLNCIAEYVADYRAKHQLEGDWPCEILKCDEPPSSEKSHQFWYNPATCQLHRISGPAVVLEDGYTEWWIEGCQLSEDGFTEWTTIQNTLKRGTLQAGINVNI